jgi:hypothetical protein
MQTTCLIALLRAPLHMRVSLSTEIWFGTVKKLFWKQGYPNSCWNYESTSDRGARWARADYGIYTVGKQMFNCIELVVVLF